MKFELKINRRNIPEKELLDDLLKVEGLIDKPISKAIYNKHGRFSSGTYEKRFGTWNKALECAGLKLGNIKNLSEKELFKNLEEVWIKLGRQPKYEEMKLPTSKYSVAPYHKRFGRWNQVLQVFIDYINSDSIDDTSNLIIKEEIINEKEAIKHKTKRGISDRLRFKILMRDGFTCKSCGRSPVTELGVELHVDHITPWSKGGETKSENLETKCKRCNLGKGNEFDK